MLIASLCHTADLPKAVSPELFSSLKSHSPFSRILGSTDSLILTGLLNYQGETVAAVHDLETRRTHLVSEKGPNLSGWQLIDLRGDTRDLSTLTTRIKINASDIVSVRYQKAPPMPLQRRPVLVSTRIGDGSAGGGTDPHGGPNPDVLTPDQLANARNAAKNPATGFKADGFSSHNRMPAEMLSKLNQLSYEQRETIHIKLFQQRNRGLGSQERRQMYGRLIDAQLRNR